MILAIMGTAATSAAESYWMSVYGGSNNDTHGTGTAVGSDGSAFMAFRSQSAGAGAFDILVIKISTTGSLLLQRSLGTVNNENGMGVAVASNGNFYVSGGFGNPIFADGLIAKYNSSGTVQWQRGYDPGSSQSSNAYEVGLDSSENVYQMLFDGVADALVLVKYNSSGTLQWQRRLSGANTDVLFGGYTASNGDSFICGFTRSGSIADNAAFIAKYNTSGTIQWQTHFYTSGKTSTFYNTTVDTSGNIYAVGVTNAVNASNDIFVVKMNSSGTVQWQRRFGNASFANEGYGIATDSANNVYVSGNSSSDMAIVKYNTSGTIQWQRRVGTPTGTNVSYGLNCDSKDNLIVFGFSTGVGSGSNDAFIMKIPNDGTLTGTYSLAGVNVTYATTTLTDAATTLTQAATSLTDAAASGSDSASSLTAATPSLTYSTRTLP